MTSESLNLDTLSFDPEEAGKPNVYEVSWGGERRKLFLAPSNESVRFSPQSSYETLQRRAFSIWRATGGEGDVRLGGQLIFDLAASSFDDDTAVRLAQAHKALLQDKTIWGRLRTLTPPSCSWA